MISQIAIPPGKELMTYQEFAESYGLSDRTVKRMVAEGELLLMSRVKEGSAARINMVAFRARLLQQAINCKYVPA
ncbi:MAG: helix-turn-helix domain-containing protein [Ewingella americana]|jgi:excisionase family DNA binding protein|uniref:hypothetical protein n=1 Tax=Ewingella americana TaxID=41202 RepID=UPI00242DA498|nr:hypothetical protein [Ewingella americana]MCI1680028.1 helix-turn-helix domain-containing protein [Ewingella americana]MCI1855023.1 helix-turn-helix domain-containing protein [Ewingella americana]MCI1863500.1 helix-turn-helix domain-containing protein [Ewingella americana]MCI2143370.1 helix-turn-helix domain-containing protein [Ewingella americana]MCI2164527.1 helix-turn-helix domain-containing protein [Ewingella americana]